MNVRKATRLPAESTGLSGAPGAARTRVPSAVDRGAAGPQHPVTRQAHLPGNPPLLRHVASPTVEPVELGSGCTSPGGSRPSAQARPLPPSCPRAAGHALDSAHTPSREHSLRSSSRSQTMRRPSARKVKDCQPRGQLNACSAHERALQLDSEPPTPVPDVPPLAPPPSARSAESPHAARPRPSSSARRRVRSAPRARQAG